MNKAKPKQTKEDIYETLIFGWLLQGMGGDTLENVERARDLLKNYRLGVIDTFSSMDLLREEEHLEGCWSFETGGKKCDCGIEDLNELRTEIKEALRK